MNDTNSTSDDQYSIEELCSLIRGILANRVIKVIYLLLWLATFLAWPFVALISVFMFDSPFRSDLDECMRYAIASCLVSYPVIISVLLMLGYFLMKQTGRTRYYYGMPWLLIIFIVVCWLLNSLGSN